ncbi:TolC family protein [Puteibacter caeruleilacunae]|nr:TolC family protein [Puteibacter caeruleilacunae]
MKNILIALIILVGTAVQAQQPGTPWTLERCINYAFENNIQIRRQVLNTKYQENQLYQSKMNQLPNLNGSIGSNRNFGRTLTPGNIYEDVNSTSLNAGLTSQIDVFAGSTLKNTVKQREFELKSSLEDLHKAKDDIAMMITSAYLEILLAQELVAVSEGQLDITKLQIDRTNKLVEAGSEPKGKLLEVQAQYAKEELSLVEAQNNVLLTKLKLAQLLDLKSVNGFEIVNPELPGIESGNVVVDAEDVYSRAVEIRPEIKGAEYSLQGREKQLDVAKGGLLPTLTLGGGYNTDYNSETSKKIQDPAHPDDPTKTIPKKVGFSEQVKNFQRKYVGLSLQIPIFNRHSAKTQVSNARIQMLDSELNLENAKNQLREDIETAYTNAVASLKKYMANDKAVVNLKEAFRYMEERYNLGVVNSVDYNEAKNNLTAAQSNLLQAKYEFIFRTKILDFYKGVPITL